MLPIDRLGRPNPLIPFADERRGVPAANAGLKYPAEIYTPSEIHALMRAAGRGLTGARLRALIALYWRCGLRASEGLALELRDIDLDQGTVVVRHGKGDKRRMLGIDDQALAVVEVWLAARAGLGVPRGSRVFCTITRGNIGSPYGYPSLAERLREVGQKAGLEKRVHAHGFRHTAAVDWLREGHSPLHIMKMLGHSDLATTMRYLDHLAPAEVIDIARSRTWPAAALAAA